jgi:hypothetical protein
MLKDKDMDVNTALAIAKVSESIINTAKVEIQYMKTIESDDRSLFLEGGKE